MTEELKPNRYMIDGWEAPKWATKHEIEDGHISWYCYSAEPLEMVSIHADYEVTRYQPTIVRFDDFELDPAAGTLAIVVGHTAIHVADDTEVTAAQARKLAAALLELADIVDATECHRG